MAEMIWGKAEEIVGELSDLVTTHVASWARSIVLASDDVVLPGDIELSNVLELGTALVFHHHAAYSRRIFQDMQRLPFALFWFARQEPRTPCERRQCLAQAILAKEPRLLETNTHKLRCLCADDMVECAESGTVGPLLYAIVASWVLGARSDVAINEGHNSLIKAIAARCRSIGLPLLSARANIKKELRVGVRGAPQRWTHVKKDALSMVQASWWFLGAASYLYSFHFHAESESLSRYDL